MSYVLEMAAIADLATSNRDRCRVRIGRAFEDDDDFVLSAVADLVGYLSVAETRGEVAGQRRFAPHPQPLSPEYRGEGSYKIVAFTVGE